jgi:hypothetical protein
VTRARIDAQITTSPSSPIQTTETCGEQSRHRTPSARDAQERSGARTPRSATLNP